MAEMQKENGMIGTTNPSPSTLGITAAPGGTAREIGKHVAPSADGAGSGQTQTTVETLLDAINA